MQREHCGLDHWRSMRRSIISFTESEPVYSCDMLNEKVNIGPRILCRTRQRIWDGKSDISFDL